MTKKVGTREQFRNRELAREAGRKGGLVGGAKRRVNAPKPYSGSITDLMDAVGLTGLDWAAWRAILKAAFCLPLTDDELLTYQRLTGRDTPPAEPVLELWLCCGRRAGKSTIAALVALFKGITADPKAFAQEEELVVIPVIAADRKQSRVLLGHLRSFARYVDVMRYVANADLAESIELANGIRIEVQTSSSRATRGYTAVSVVNDEVAFWPTEGADPAEEILEAIRPTMGTVPNPLLLALSNPHAAMGPLFDSVDKYYAKAEASEADRVLVVMADTLSLHPSFNPAVVKRAITRDAVRALSEYGTDGKIQFRQGSKALFDQLPVDASIVTARRELPPLTSVPHVAFLDAAQGARSGDSMTLGIGHYHAASGMAVIDKLLERRPPFSPVDVLVNEFVPALKRYGIRRVVGDNVSRGFVEHTLKGLGITFDVSAQDKSQLYLNLLNVINSNGCELLDDQTLRLQLLSLQRYATQGGRDRVDHPKGRAYHDDVANVVAGVVGLIGGVAGKALKRALFTGSSAGGRQVSQHEKLGMMAKMINAKLDREAEANRLLEEKYADGPMLSPPIWRVNGQGGR